MTASPSSKASVAILERNRVVGQRVARVIAAASHLDRVAHTETPTELEAVVGPETKLLACEATDLALAQDFLAAHPEAQLMVWSGSRTDPLIRAATREPRFSNVIGWPGFASMPRAWEIAYAARRILHPDVAPPTLADLLGWGNTTKKWRPKTSEDRDYIVAQVTDWSERAGAPPRVSEKLSVLAHELLMNAMYDAPVDEHGRPRYAHDRKQHVELETAETPTLRIGSNGLYIGIEVVDPFGLLKRKHVFDGIARGLGGKESQLSDVLDVSNGGAGLGMLKIHSSSAVLLVDVERGRSTTITALYDLDVNPREFRGLPISLHFFDRVP